MEEFEKKVNELTSRANQRTTDLLLDQASSIAQFCENIFHLDEPNTTYLEILGGRRDRLDRIRQNDEKLGMEGNDIVEWTSKEITTLVKSLVGNDWPVIEQTLSENLDEEPDSEAIALEGMSTDGTQE